MLLDGRDIGTVVLKDAPVKIYLTATAEARARRRLLQLEEKGEHPDFEAILAEVNARDRQDIHRQERCQIHRQGIRPHVSGRRP